MTSIVCGMAALLFVHYGTDRTGWLNPNLWGLVASVVGYLGTLARRRSVAPS